jgi:hypothetical protein
VAAARAAKTQVVIDNRSCLPNSVAVAIAAENNVDHRDSVSHTVTGAGGEFKKSRVLKHDKQRQDYH